MDNSKETQHTSARLVGWKRISSHLGCSDRTARRWEQDESLPIHRQLHETKSTVFAYPDELDAWLASRAPETVPPSAPRPEKTLRPWRQPLPLAVIGACLVLLLGLVMLPPSKDQPAPSTALSDDPIAADLYERGRTLWLQRGEVPISRAIKLLEQAVERDPEFAEAWAALASAWLTYPTYNDEASAQASLDKAFLAADRALSIDPTLGEPQIVKASIARNSRDWFRAEEIYESAIAASPDNATLYMWYASLYRDLGLADDARALVDKALELDPNSPPTQVERAMNTLQIDIDEGAAKLDYLWSDLGFKTPVIWTGLWISHILRDEFASAEAWVDQNVFFPEASDLMRRFVAEMESPNPQLTDILVQDIQSAYESGLFPWMAFYMMINLDRPEAALDLAQAEADKGYFDTSVVFFDRYYSAHRETERFADIVEQLGYVDYWKVRGAPKICASEPNTPFCLRITDNHSPGSR